MLGVRRDVSTHIQAHHTCARIPHISCVQASKRSSGRSSFAVEKDGDHLKNTIGGRAKARLQQQPSQISGGCVACMCVCFRV
jgi:hypothetical protein